MKPIQSISASLKRIEQTYERIKSAIDSKLFSKGYRIMEEKYHPAVFGSRLAVWSNGSTSIRLLWDGKDEVFYLQTLNRLRKDWTDAWEDVSDAAFDPKQPDQSYIHSIEAKILGGLDDNE